MSIARLRALTPAGIGIRLRRSGPSRNEHRPIEGIDTTDARLLISFHLRRNEHRPIEGIDTCSCQYEN